MKNVFIDDFYNQIFPSLIDKPDINIVGIHVKFQYEVDEIKRKHPEIPVYLSKDINTWDKSFVSRDDIKSNYKSQVKEEHFYERQINYNTQSVKMSNCYSSLSFWKYIFDNFKIDCVLVGHIDHGSPVETLLIDIAIERGIKTYVFEPMLHNELDGNAYYSIKFCNTNEYLDLTDVSSSFDSIKNLDQYINELISNNINTKKIDCIFTYDDLQKFTISDKMKKVIVFVINTIYFIPKLVCNIFGKDFNTVKQGLKLLKKIGNVRKYIYILIDIVIGKRIEDELQGHIFYINAIEYIKGAHYVHSLRRYYQKHAEKIIPKNQKYILYALHLEPEASIMARTIYNSQIYNIKMLSHALPDGWKLYVKEHPVQFDTNNGFGYMPSAYNFRDKKYYEIIQSFPNTYLFDYKISSGSLLSGLDDKCPKPSCVSTINGSITLEAVLKNIPTLVFDYETISYKSHLILRVDNEDDIINFLKMIDNTKLNDANNDNLLDSLRKRLFIVNGLEYQLSNNFIRDLIYF